MTTPTYGITQEEKDELFQASTDGNSEARRIEANKAWTNHMAIVKGIKCPIATGTPKQLKWAIDIWEDFTASANAEGFLAEDVKLFCQTHRAKTARFWIENRSQPDPRTCYSDRRLQKAIAAEIAEIKRDQQAQIKSESMTEPELRTLARRF